MGLTLHYDCLAGISGDMNLAALCSLGVPQGVLLGGLQSLSIVDEFELEFAPSSKCGIHGLQVRIHDRHLHGHHDDDHHHHRTLKDIEGIISSSTISEKAKDISLRVFRKLAEAEADVHGCTPDGVHFHEVGAVDSMVDIIGGAICLDHLGVDCVTASTLELGSGTIKCAHGIMPVPAPATAILTQGMPTSLGGTDHEATTPTGAAYLATVVDIFNPHLTGICIATGIGIGHRDSDKLPNILRVCLYKTDEHHTSDISQEECVELCTNIDDMTGEHLAYLCEKLYAAGAVDVWQEPIVMKKGRVGVKVCSLCSVSAKEDVLRAYFIHSSTLGVREYRPTRHLLHREETTMHTPAGDITVKRAWMDGTCIKSKPSFDDCKRLAEQSGKPIRDITP